MKNIIYIYTYMKNLPLSHFLEFNILQLMCFPKNLTMVVDNLRSVIKCLHISIPLSFRLDLN